MVGYLKKQTLVGLALATALMPLASAQLTYLSCLLPPDKKTPELRFDFTLDEIAGTVSFYWNGQNLFLKENAAFTADKVTWIQPFYLGSSIHRTINRVTLEYTDEMIDGRKVTVSKGTCKVIPPPADRKF